MKHSTYQNMKEVDIRWLDKLPYHWQVSRLKHIAHINSQTLGEGVTEDFMIQYIDIGNVTLQGVQNPPEEMRFEGAPSRARRIVKSGDTIISTVRTYLQAIAFFENPPNNLIASTGFAVLTPTKKVYPKYLYYLVLTPRFINDVTAHSIGISYPAINPSDLANLSVWLPDLHEQQAIADFLDRETSIIDTLIAKKQALIERLQEKRTALISHTVTKGLDPTAPMKDSGIEWLGQIPAHWQTIRSKWLFALRKTKAYPSDRQITVSQKYGPIYQDDFVELEGRRVMEVIKGADILLHIEPNDFVISMRSFQGGIEHSKVRGSVSSAYVVLIPAPSVQKGFYAHLLKSSQYIQALQGTTNLIRDGQAIRYSHFILVDLPVVPLDEQVQIAEYLDRETAQIDTLIQKLKEAITRLKEYRTALISAVVTGKVDVRAHAQGEF